MRLVRLSPSISVMPDAVSTIEVNEQRTGVRVVMKNGAFHFVSNGYGEAAHQTFDKIQNKIDEALQ